MFEMFNNQLELKENMYIGTLSLNKQKKKKRLKKANRSDPTFDKTLDVLTRIDRYKKKIKKKKG